MPADTNTRDQRINSCCSNQYALYRFKPGDFARITYSTSRPLLREVVVVEGLNDEGRWNVCLMGLPAFGITAITKRPVITHEFTFSGSSLEPMEPREVMQWLMQQSVSRREAYRQMEAALLNRPLLLRIEQ